MATLSEGNDITDWLKSEEPNAFSRDTATIASGQGKLATGTVLGKLAANGKYVVSANTGSDGSQTSAAILVTPVDATSADQKAVIVSRDAIVSHAGLVYGASINDAAKRATANGQLGAVGILVREGA